MDNVVLNSTTVHVHPLDWRNRLWIMGFGDGTSTCQLRFFIKVSQHLTIFPDGILMRDCFGSLSTRTYDWHIWIERVIYNLSYDHYT